MLIFVLFFLMVFRGATQVFGAVFGSIAAIETICSLLIFAFIALAIGAKWKLGWVGMFLSIIVMVAVRELAPYESAVEILVSAVIAFAAALYTKRTMNPYVRRCKTLPCWVQRILLVIWDDFLQTWLNQQKWK